MQDLMHPAHPEINFKRFSLGGGVIVVVVVVVVGIKTFNMDVMVASLRTSSFYTFLSFFPSSF